MIRNGIWIVVAALVVHVCTTGLPSGCAAAEPPHIVIYLSDDHSQFDSSLYGNANIPTPHLEELASAGMTFSHAFVASPSCAPSRAALLTGLMPARNGAEANHTQPRKDAHSLIPDLKSAGYEVVAIGKVAHGKSAPRYGFDQSIPAANIDRLQRLVADFLQRRQADQPLCLFVGTSNPHVPWSSESSFDPATVEFPPHHLDTPATRRNRAAYYEEIKQLDALLGSLRNMANRHLGDDTIFLHSSDHGSQWPFGKWNLYDYGTRVPLIVSWPGHIEPASRSNAMVSWVDLLPTLIEAAGGTCPDDLDGRSFLGVLRGEAADHRERIFTTHTGDGRMNIYPIRSVRTQEWKLIHNLHPEFAHTNHSDLKRRPLSDDYWNEWARLANSDDRARDIVARYFQRPEWELYHVVEDKWEQHNVADDPAQTQRLASLKQQLADWMDQQGDQRQVHAEPRPLSDPKQWHPDFTGQSSK